MISLEKVLKEILPIYSIYSMDNIHLRQEYKGSLKKGQITMKDMNFGKQ